MSKTCVQHWLGHQTGKSISWHPPDQSNRFQHKLLTLFPDSNRDRGQLRR
jgi:hypothetical protein